MADRRRSVRERLEAQEGFSLIELVVAMALMAVALVAIVGSFDSSRKLIGKAERIETATHIGQQELERMMGKDYATVATSTLPANASDEFDPRYYVKADGTGYQWDHSISTRVENFVAASGTLPPSSAWYDGATRLSGDVWRFITWVDDPNITGAQNAKRITVAVSVAGRVTKPVTFTSILWDRKAL
jgi:prepilin-type N-terminal cleavage/methylation domain-containing protein